MIDITLRKKIKILGKVSEEMVFKWCVRQKPEQLIKSMTTPGSRAEARDKYFPSPCPNLYI